MKKIKILLVVMSAMLLLVAVAPASAASGFAVVDYNDTSLEVGYIGFLPVAFQTDCNLDVVPFALNYVDSALAEGCPGDGGSFIGNGDFNDWSNDANGNRVPTGWTVWPTSAAGGWEGPHVGGLAHSPNDDSLSLFIRNVGGAAPFSVGAYTHLDQIPADGHYWVSVHSTMFGGTIGDSFDIYDRLYNAVMWYGIGSSSDPSSVTKWRELVPWSAPCANDIPFYNMGCIYMGRHETVEIHAGDYFHLKASHKFAFPDWTVFNFDDIYITSTTGEYVDDGFAWEGILVWNPNAIR